MTSVADRDVALGWRFFSALLRDEIGLEAVKALRGGEVLSTLQNCCPAGENLATALEEAGAEGLFTEIRYEYAELFLNAGKNPVFPYESVHVTETPLVMQKPVFALREHYRKAGVKAAASYPDLEEHVAVEMEFLAYLLESGNKEHYDEFLESFKAWAPAFGAQLRDCAQTDFYKELAGLFLGALESDAMLANLATCAKALGIDDSLVTLEKGELPQKGKESINSHCYVCGALCGMEAKLEDGVFMSVGGLKGDPKSGGKLCPKGGSNPKHVYSAYRLKAPLIREGERFRKASWDEALDRAAEGIKKIPEGKLAYFRGNDWNKFVHEAFFDALGCPKGTHRTMCDNSNRMANEHNLNDKRPWINYQESDYIILFGLNELASSYGQRKVAEFKDALKRGAKLVVFDPRKSETAAKATRWIPVVPSSDAAIALGMAWVIITEDLYDKDFVANWTTGFEEFKNHVLGKDDGVERNPKWAEAISGVPAETITEVAREFAQAKNKGAISWTGLAQVPNAHWGTAAIQSLNGLCGCFDAPGGPSLPFKRKLGSAWGPGQQKPPKKDAPKVEKFGLWAGWSPARFEAQVDAGLIKGLVMYWGDPVLTWGNSASVTRGVEKVDFTLVVDAFMCNTALLADVVLPECTWLEQPQMLADWLYEAFISYYAKIVDPMYNTRTMFDICRGLAARMDMAQYFPWDNLDDALRNMLLDKPWSYDELKEKGFIITDEAAYYKYKTWGSLNPPDGYGSSGKTKTGKYNFVNPVSVEKGVHALPDYMEPPAELRPDEEYPFIFGNFRLLQHEHCSTFNNWQLMKLRGSNELWINSAQAQELGLSKGDMARLVSPWGSCELPVLPTDDIKPGVLGAAGGYGHLRGLEGDPKYPHLGGVNVPGSLMKPNEVEPTGGTPLLKYIKCRVERV